MFLCSRKFSAGTTQKVSFPLHSNWIFLETFVNGKQSKKEQDEKCPLAKNQLVGAN